MKNAERLLALKKRAKMTAKTIDTTNRPRLGFLNEGRENGKDGPRGPVGPEDGGRSEGLRTIANASA